MNKQVRFFLFTAIFGGWIIFYTKVLFDGIFEVDFHLPLELCNFMQLLILYAVIKNKAKVLDMLIYPAILGPIAALIYPFGVASFGPFYLVYFIFYHVTLIFIGVYRLAQRKAGVNINDLFRSLMFMSVSAIFASTANAVTGGNYMFLSEEIFPTPINYQVFLILFALLGITSFHFAIVFGRYLVVNSKAKYRKRKTSTV
jgi:uncharacterized membrane protein YwaF